MKSYSLSTTINYSLLKMEFFEGLAVTAIIRTFLNYFLGKELEAELALEKEKADN